MKLITGLLLVLCLLKSPSCFGQTLTTQVPEEPNFSQIKEWVLDFSLGIVASFNMDGGIVYFSYPILSQKPVKDCVPYREVGDELYLTDNGWLYIVKKQPNLYRYETQNWKMWDVRK